MAGLASTWTGSRIWGDGTIGGESRVTGVRMRVTGVGHAGLFIETHAGSVVSIQARPSEVALGSGV